MGFDYKANYSYIESDMQHSTLAGSNNTIPAGIFALMVGYRSGIIESGMTLKYVSPYDDRFLQLTASITRLVTTPELMPIYKPCTFRSNIVVLR